MNPIIIVLITFCSTFIGGLLAFKLSKHIHFLNAFSAGILLGVVFFDLLPEAIELHKEAKLALIITIIGFFIFYVMQRFLLIHTLHEHDDTAPHDTHNIGIMGATGMAIHSFLDGAAIGLGFVINPKIGIIIAFAVIMHDFGDGVSTVTIMLRHKNTQQKTMLLLFIDALAPLVGVLIAINLTIAEAWLGLILAFFAGFFLYISTSDLLPEAHRENNSYLILFATALGTVIVFFITRFL